MEKHKNTGDINFILQFGDSVDELKCTISIQKSSICNVAPFQSSVIGGKLVILMIIYDRHEHTCMSVFGNIYRMRF